MRKILGFLFILLIILIVVYLFGPKVKFPPLETSIPNLDNYVFNQESKIKDLRAGNEARIVWANDTVAKTDYSIVYLHGFSASPMESDPVAFDIAKKFSCNMYLGRLADHGRNSIESFVNIKPNDWISIGKLLGEKVIVMSCSTGSTLSAYLAAENPSSTDAMIMYSPNFALHDGKRGRFLKAIIEALKWKLRQLLFGLLNIGWKDW